MALRTPRERVIQTLSFEAGGLLIATPAYAIAFGEQPTQSFVLVVALSAAVMLWSPLFNTVFDWVDFGMTGRVASKRPHRLRIIHAVGHETSTVLVTLPLVMWIGGFGFLDGLAVDIGLSLFYAAYGYVFHIAFDWLRPVHDDAGT